MSDKKQKITNYEPLKLRAEDDKDLEVLSECLFESVCLEKEMQFLKESKTFLMCLDRFTWEFSGLSSENLLEVQCILQVDYVKSVLFDGLYRSGSSSLLSLISIAYSDKYLMFSFDKGRALTLETSKLRVFIEDIGSPIFPATVPSRKKGISI